MNKMTNAVKDTYNSTLTAIQNLDGIVDDLFYKIVDKMFEVEGKVIIMGMGKSGIIGKKVAATLASTGTSSFFIHPGEAFHGDLGMIESKDIVVMLSNSGNSQEIVDVIPNIKNLIKAPIVAITSNKNSQLAQESDYKIIYDLPREGYLDLPPLASTTTQLVIGDLLATALMEKRNFQDSNYAVFHPGGSLGKKLLLTLKNVVKKNGSNIDKILINPQNSVSDAIIALSKGQKGGVVIVDKDKNIQGIFTDGDLRRVLEKYGSENTNNMIISEIMTKNPKVAYFDEKPIDVLNRMETYNITFLPIVDNNVVVGSVTIHELLKEGLK